MESIESQRPISDKDSLMRALQKPGPLVSICIPTYNAEKTIAHTVQSVINQTYLNLEIIVCDNASIDNTLEVLNDFDDERICVYSNETNIGAENNWSRCIQIARGKYIAIYHADDLYSPEIVEEQVRILEGDPQIGAAFTNANHIDEHGRVRVHVKMPFESLKNGDSKIYFLKDVFSKILKHGNFLICPSAMVRAEIYKNLAPFNYDQFRTSADLDMWLRILEHSPISIINKPLMSYRISKRQGGFAYRYLRTDGADFIKVMDYHLARCADDLNVSKKDLVCYELIKSNDGFFRSMNHLIKGESKESKQMLKDILFSNLKNLSSPNHWPLILKISSVLIMVYAGLGKCAARIYRQIKYGNCG